MQHYKIENHWRVHLDNHNFTIFTQIFDKLDISSGKQHLRMDMYQQA